MIKNIPYKYIFLGLSIVIFGVFSLWPLTSEALQKKQRYSELEKIGFAFHKLGGFNPDFASWIRSTDKYKESSLSKEASIIQRGLPRLENEYYNYSPNEDLISLTIDATLKTSQDYKKSQKKGSMTDVKITLTDLPENYFPFQIGDIWVAIVIKDYDTLVNFILTKDEYAEFAKKLRFDKYIYTLAHKVNVDFKLRPLSVDTSSPIELDGIKMWLMLVEIGDMTVWYNSYKKKQILLNHEAPWYVEKGEKELRALFRN